nr:hypothetical protein [Dysgonomonas sp. Marseille-P4677]
MYLVPLENVPLVTKFVECGSNPVNNKVTLSCLGSNAELSEIVQGLIITSTVATSELLVGWSVFTVAVKVLDVFGVNIPVVKSNVPLFVIAEPLTVT